MKPWLKDLKPGDEFEYAEATQIYRQGKFLVLNSEGKYFWSATRDDCVFIFSFLTKKVCQHWGLLDVNIISKPEKIMENKMGHFIGWKFGVPVKVSSRHILTPYTDQVLLIKETDRDFTVQFTNFIKVYSKQHYCYELIPYRVSGHNDFIYLVCHNDAYITFCNFAQHLKAFESVHESYVKPIPSATLNIDGKTIELSVETTAELKKKLGV